MARSPVQPCRYGGSLDGDSRTIEGPVGDIRSQRQRPPENKFGMRRWRSSALLSTVKKCGRDRGAGFSAIPAMSMLSYAAGSRFVRLFGAPVLTFYDFYLDFPPASSETGGEKADGTDSHNSKEIGATGNNLLAFIASHHTCNCPSRPVLQRLLRQGGKWSLTIPEFEEDRL
jgi:hypothetical protein